MAKHKGKTLYQDQRTSLWMAGGYEGVDNNTIVTLDGFSSLKIMNWLISLTSYFYDSIRDSLGVRSLGEKPIFIAFGFGYDVGQIVKDLPYEKRLVLNAGKPYEQKDNLRYIADLASHSVLYRGYAMYYIPGQKFVLKKLTNPDKPYCDPDSKGKRELNTCEEITIYDTFGFFQQKFTGSVERLPRRSV